MVRMAAVLVGVDNPAGPMDPLRFAEKDMLDLTDHLTSPAGGCYSRDDICLLTNRKAILPAVAQALCLVPSRCDCLLFAFSGHGDSSGIALRDRVLLYPDLRAMLEMSHAKRTLVLVDACGAGGFLKRAAVLEGLDPGVFRAAHAEAVFRSAPGMRALMSCGATEKSREGVIRDNGEFMGALLHACQLEFGDTDGVITAEAAFEYAKLYLQAIEVPQTPEAFGPLTGFPLGLDPRYVSQLVAWSGAGRSRDRGIFQPHVT